MENKIQYAVVLDFTLNEVFTYAEITTDIEKFLEERHNLNNCQYMTAFEKIKIN